MSIKIVLNALLALCLMIGCVAGADFCVAGADCCVAGADFCRYDSDISVLPIDPVIPFTPINPHSEDVGSQLAEYYKELFENLFGGGGRPPFLTA